MAVFALIACTEEMGVQKQELWQLVLECQAEIEGLQQTLHSSQQVS